MKRRIFAMLLVFAMVFAMAFGVSAEETEANGTAALSLELTYTAQQELLVVQVWLEGCDGVSNGRFTLSYDEALTLEKTQVSEAYAMSSVNSETEGAVSLAWVGSALTAEKTLMLTLEFQAAQIPEGELCAVSSAGIYADETALEVAGATATDDLIPEEVPEESTEPEETTEPVETTEPEQTEAPGETTEPEQIETPDETAEPEETTVPEETEVPGESTGEVPPDEGSGDAEEDGEDPDTGDTAGIWIALLMISVAGVAGVLCARRSKYMGRFLSLVLAAAMMFGMLPVHSSALVRGQDDSSRNDLSAALEELVKDRESAIVTGEEDTDPITASKIEDMDIDLTIDRNTAALDQSTYADDEMVRVIVELEDGSLLEQGFSQSEIVEQDSKIRRATATMQLQQNKIADQIGDIVEKTDCAEEAAEVKYHYTIALNGVAMEVPYGTLADIRALDGVKNAYVVSQYTLPEEKKADYETNMYATNSGFGTLKTWTELGYTGKGMVIAVVDTGLDLDHPSFAETPEGAAMTIEDVRSVLPQLKAYTLFTETSAVELTAEDVYRSGKVPYGFNYVDRGLDVTHDFDDQGDHGTHVAGTAAANRLETTDVVGVAPDAQVIVMKVFGQNGGAFADDIIASIEDCVMLDVDVVNMSLGSPAGFSEDSELINQVFGRILECDMILACAAGNSGSAANGNTLGTNLNLTQDPDIGMVTSPSTYIGSTMVASIENSSMMMPYFTVGENKIAYVDINYDFTDLEGVREYVMVPGLGDEADYEGLDVNGKIAVVERGTIDFETKQKVAYGRGAAALVVYDNTDGDLISMYSAGLLPNVFISKANGAILAAAADENGCGTLEVMGVGKETAIPSSTAGQLSDFSAWGVTPDLLLAPDVTAPGGNIYSCLTDGHYGTMSGTSMASPHIAGMSALVLQYLHDVYPDLTEAEMHAAAESLVMCTAVPVEDPEGVLYSPRKQGAGSANVYSALTSPVYLIAQQANGELTPKASIGDDPTRTGVYTFSFEMHNLDDTIQTYVLDGVALTDQYVEIEGEEYLGEADRYLDGAVTFSVSDDTALSLEYDANLDGNTNLDDVQFLLDVVNELEELDESLKDHMDLNSDGAWNTVDAQRLYELIGQGYEARKMISVPANGTVTVNVTVTLTAEDKAYMDEHYESGIYVEGFVRCYAQSDKAVDLSFPYLAFYGDWTDARMIDNGWYYEDSEELVYNRYLNVIFANMGESAGGLGLNPYLLDDVYSPEENVLSPNGDGYYDYVNEIYVSLLRSAELLDFTWTDEEGKELFYEWYAYARKSYYWSGYGTCLPAIYTDAECQPYTMLDDQGNLLVKDNQKIYLTIRGYLDDGDLDALEVSEEGTPLPNTDWADDSVTIPVTIDITAPTMDISSIEYTTGEDGRNYVSFDVEDNYDIAAVVSMTVGGDIYEYIPVETKTPGVDGEKATITIDVTDYDATFNIAICDYGCNETYYELVNSANDGLDSNNFYGFRRYSTAVIEDSIYVTDQLNGWYSFETADSMIMHTSQPESGEATVYAAEYIDGYVFGAQDGGEENNGANTLFVMKAGSWDRVQIGNNYSMRKTVYEWPGRDGTYFPLTMIALDMAFDYTDGTLYLLANGLENNYFPEGEENILLKVDYMTGDVTVLGVIQAAEGEEFLALTLACDNDGNLYTINYENGQLYSISKTPTSTTEKYGYGTYEATCISTVETVYWPAAYTQAMTVDHATNTLYWSGYQGKTGNAYFFEVDKTTGELVTITDMEDNAELVALFKPYDTEQTAGLIPDAALESIYMGESNVYLNVGQNSTLSVLPQPFNASVGQITWTSADESVATVSAYGMVEAKGIGTTVVTAVCGDLTAQCTVNVSAVSGTLFAHSGEYWMLMDSGDPASANQVIDATATEGEVKAAAYLNGFIYAAAVEEDYNDYGDATYTTNLYKLDANTLTGEIIDSFEGNVTALAFNYADGYLYGLKNDPGKNAELIRVNTTTAAVLSVASLEELFNAAEQWETCSGAMAIDYEGNFYVNGDQETESGDWANVLVKFALDENDRLTDVTTFSGFSGYSWSGDAMVWSQRNNGIIRASGENLSWVDVSDMENVIEVQLGEVRGASGYVWALAIPLTYEPELPEVLATAVYLDECYTVPAGEIVRVKPTADPWNANCEFAYTIGDESIATVDAKGVITGIAEGETTVTVTVPGTEISATAKVVVEKNPGYLYGFAQADIAQGIELEYWVKMPIFDSANSAILTDAYDFTIYAAEYYDGYVYAYAMSTVDYLYYFIKINPSNFAYQILAQGEVLVRDMAFDYTTGTMYAIANTEMVSGGLYQMDLETAELTLVGDNDLGASLVTLAVDGNGVMYAADDYGEVFVVDKDTVQIQSTGIYGGASQYLQAMAYDHNNDSLYWVKQGKLYQIDTENFTLNELGYADINSGEMFTVGCIVSGLFSVPLNDPEIPETVTPAGVVLDEKNTVAVGECLTLDAVVLPVSVSAVDQSLTWTSADETIATVEGGVVTGIAAGEVMITATDAAGNSDSVVITVTAEARAFYAYDEISHSWVSFGMDGVITGTWAEEEGLSPIVAAQYIGDTLYAYDQDGIFYTVDTETFQRTKLGDGISGMTATLEANDKANGYHFVEGVPYQVVDMTFAESRRGYVAYAVLMAYNVSEWLDDFSYKFVRIDLADGSVTEVIAEDQLVDDMSLRPSNLIYRNGYLYTVNGYITGLITKVDLVDGSLTGTNIFASYWGDFNGGRSFIEDPLTGEVYAIRDMRTDYIGVSDYDPSVSQSVLCTIDIGIARADKVCEIGTGLRLVGLFIK